SADLVLRAAEQLDLAAGPVVPVEGLGHGRRFAEDRESRLEVVFDPTGKLGTTGALDDFLRDFRSRFEKMSALFRQRIDTGSAGEEVYAVLISDVHVGSKVFMEDAFGRVLRGLKGEVGGPDQRHISDHVKYVLIGGDLVDGIGVYPRQEVDSKVPDIYEQYR